jgi:hypothetical protein
MFSLQQNWRKGKNRFCLEARGWRGEGGSGASGGRNDPNNEHINKEKNFPSEVFTYTYCSVLIGLFTFFY